jgi:hypothetical protein
MKMPINRYQVIGFLGILCIIVGTTAIAGYVTENDHLYKWTGTSSSMAVNTAIVSILAGISLILISLALNYIDDNEKKDRGR